MAPYGGLQQIFEKPPPENPSLIESLSTWKQILPVKPTEQSYTELFGELHFRENLETSLPSALVSEAAASWSSGSTSFNYQNLEVPPFSWKNSESLQLCTEGIGFESLDGIDDMKIDTNSELINREKTVLGEHSTRYMVSNQYKIAKSCGSSCPPPISSLGKTGNTWVCFKSYRKDGRFVLEEVRTPTQEYFHASREDGRLRLCLVQPEEEDDEEEEDGEEKHDQSV